MKDSPRRAVRFAVGLFTAVSVSLNTALNPVRVKTFAVHHVYDVVGITVVSVIHYSYCQDILAWHRFHEIFQTVIDDLEVWMILKFEWSCKSKSGQCLDKCSKHRLIKSCIKWQNFKHLICNILLSVLGILKADWCCRPKYARICILQHKLGTHWFVIGVLCVLLQIYC